MLSNPQLAYLIALAKVASLEQQYMDYARSLPLDDTQAATDALILYDNEIGYGRACEALEEAAGAEIEWARGKLADIFGGLPAGVSERLDSTERGTRAAVAGVVAMLDVNKRS